MTSTISAGDRTSATKASNDAPARTGYEPVDLAGKSGTPSPTLPSKGSGKSPDTRSHKKKVGTSGTNSPSGGVKQNRFGSTRRQKVGSKPKSKSSPPSPK